MNKYIIQLGDLEWPKVLGISLLVVVLYYFGVFDDGSSLQAQVQQANISLTEVKKKLEETKKALADADRFEADVKASIEQFNKVIEFMPESMNQSELMTIVSKQTALSGAKVMRIEPFLSPRDPKQDQNIDSVRVKLALQGTFSQLVAFLSNISRVPNLLTFDQVDLALSEGNQMSEFASLNFDGVLVGYKYSKKADANMPGGQLPGAQVKGGANGAL